MYATGDLGSLIGANLIGDPTVGADTGDRLLASSASEVLCFSVSLPDTTGNAYEDADTTATLDFAAEQTANND
jgi:hypothetical protein